MPEPRRSVRPYAALAAGGAVFALAVISQLVLVSYGAGGEAPPPVVATKVPESDRARLRVVDGIPVVRLTGTPYEMGRQHGVVLKEQIHFLHREYFHKFPLARLGRASLEEWAEACKPFIPEHLLEEMRGLADGADMPFDDVLLATAMLDRFQNAMCSTVVAAGEATADGDVYFGRNLDFPGRGLLHRMTVVLVFEPEGGTPLVSVTWPGIIGVLSGMNAKGVCGATMLIRNGPLPRPGLPYLLMYREALAGAATVKEVHDSIAAAKRTCTNNFMVVDASGTARVIEWTPDACAFRDAAGGTVCSTNHFRSDELEGVGRVIGEDRYRTLEQFLRAERGRIDADRVRGALAEVATPWFNNVQSMIFLPRRRGLLLSVGGELPAAKQPFAALGKDVLFGVPVSGGAGGR